MAALVKYCPLLQQHTRLPLYGHACSITHTVSQYIHGELHVHSPGYGAVGVR